jgi:amino acid adenylation domain-containing protein
LQLPGVETFYPLSPMQQGMLFHSLSAGQSGMYWQQATLTLEGVLDRPLLQRAWRQVTERHAPLRTYFVWDGLKEPVQVVQREASFPVALHDWSGMSAGQQAERLEALLAADRQQGYELSRPPLQRLALVSLGGSRFHVIWSFHHILLDGWSVYRVLKDVFDAYEALRQQREPEPPPLKPFQDFIGWLRRRDLEQARAFWRAELAGFSAPTSVLEAVAASGAGSPQRVEVDTRVVRLDESASASLQALARSRQLTLNTILQGAWALLLSRYSGQRQVCFGATVSGRPAELEGSDSMVGMLINTLPVRARVEEGAQLTGWLRELQRRQAEARQFDWTPLVEIHGWSGVPRDVPLFDSIFIFANYPVELWSSLCKGSLSLRSYHAWESTNYAVNAFAEPGPRLTLGVFYDRRLCEARAIERLLGHWRTLLEGILANPEARLAQLPLLSAAEREQLAAWNATRAEGSRGALLPELIQEQVARTPEAVAAEFAGQRLTYRELNGRANVLARELRGLGVGPGVLVGIYMERSLELLVSLLGVLKAGGAYVPLDPSYPAERLSYMLEDSGAKVLLTRSSSLGSLPGQRARVLCVEAADGTAPDPGDPARAGDADELAYVIYTSGSTGRPKGVQVTHRSLVNFLESMRREPGMTSDDALLSVTTLSFDIAGLELYLPLLVGGRVVLASREEAADGERLRRRLVESGASVMQATPATWRLLLESGWAPERRFKVLCGGEALTRDLAERLLQGGSSLWNLYGPTETTIWSALCKVELDGGPVSVGRPIANTQVHLLDGQGRQVPVGVPGELCIGGEGLARGYWKRPDLTAERFVPDPFGEPGSRLYRTGDLARFLPDGRLEWLARLDHQVKVRGFRIELGEIEAALARHPAVRQAVVMVREDVAGDARLVAYVVGATNGVGEDGPARAELGARLRSDLLETLPDYMVPTGWLFLEALPLTPNGKVDRKALPRPEAQHAAGAYAAPETATDRAVAEVWQQVLRVERVGLHDNFFDLGGHSLLLMQVQGQLRRLLEREVPIVDLFRHPTVASLGRHLRNGDEERPEAAADETIEKLQVGRQRLRGQHQRRQQAGEGR